MSHLLLILPRPPDAPQVLLADQEAVVGQHRVFRRGGQIVLSLRQGDPLVVRDIREVHQ